jgi:hypothetical protein
MVNPETEVEKRRFYEGEERYNQRRVRIKRDKMNN